MIALAELPDRRVEGWRWSDLRAAANKVGGLDAAPADGNFLLAVSEAADGRSEFRAASPIASLAQSIRGHDAALYEVGENADRTISLDLKAVAGAGAHRLEFRVKRGGVLRLRETWAGEEGAMGALSLRITAEAGGRIERVVISEAAPGAVLLSDAQLELAAEARFDQVVIATGARLSRFETGLEISGRAAQVSMNGIYLAAAGLHADLTSHVVLDAEAAEVRQLVRGAARKGGRGVFQGKFLVERSAQKADADMQHNALLLEEGAEVFAKPELEIYADDVQCAHGNTAGQLNEDAIFYLRQRGIPDAEARAMITRAFLIEVLPDWLDGKLRGEAEARIDQWLGTAP